VENGLLTGISVINCGMGYSTSPYVQVIGGGGDGAVATAHVENGIVVRITVDNPGSGYTGTPAVMIASPPFSPWLDVAVSKVKVTQHVVLGKQYVLETSTNLRTWSQIGAPFTAQAEVITQELDAHEVGRNFRIRQLP
jgi:hypothetical protein